MQIISIIFPTIISAIKPDEKFEYMRKHSLLNRADQELKEKITNKCDFKNKKKNIHRQFMDNMDFTFPLLDNKIVNYSEILKSIAIAKILKLFLFSAYQKHY